MEKMEEDRPVKELAETVAGCRNSGGGTGREKVPDRGNRYGKNGKKMQTFRDNKPAGIVIK